MTSSSAPDHSTESTSSSDDGAGLAEAVPRFFARYPEKSTKKDVAHFFVGSPDGSEGAADEEEAADGVRRTPSLTDFYTSTDERSVSGRTDASSGVVADHGATMMNLQSLPTKPLAGGLAHALESGDHHQAVGLNDDAPAQRETTRTEEAGPPTRIHTSSAAWKKTPELPANASPQDRADYLISKLVEETFSPFERPPLDLSPPKGTTKDAPPMGTTSISKQDLALVLAAVASPQKKNTAARGSSEPSLMAVSARALVPPLPPPPRLLMPAPPLLPTPAPLPKPVAPPTGVAVPSSSVGPSAPASRTAARSQTNTSGAPLVKSYISVQVSPASSSPPANASPQLSPSDEYAGSPLQEHKPETSSVILPDDTDMLVNQLDSRQQKLQELLSAAANCLDLFDPMLTTLDPLACEEVRPPGTVRVGGSCVEKVPPETQQHAGIFSVGSDKQTHYSGSAPRHVAPPLEELYRISEESSVSESPGVVDNLVHSGDDSMRLSDNDEAESRPAQDVYPSPDESSVSVELPLEAICMTDDLQVQLLQESSAKNDIWQISTSSSRRISDDGVVDEEEEEGSEEAAEKQLTPSMLQAEELRRMYAVTK